jgi:hypothetical protein
VSNDDDRERHLAALRAARERIQPGRALGAEDLWAIIDALTFVLEPPPDPYEPWDVFDEAKERDAITSEPPSVYYLLRHPKL